MQASSIQKGTSDGSSGGWSHWGYRLLLLAGIGSLVVHLLLMWWLSGRSVPGHSGQETFVRVALGPPPLTAPPPLDSLMDPPQASVDAAWASMSALNSVEVDWPVPMPAGPDLAAFGPQLAQAPLGTAEDVPIRSDIDEPEAGFFGADAEGRRIAFVVDMSGSMQGERMSRTLSELCQSLRSLPDFASVRIVFYNDQLYQPFGQQWVSLDEGVAEQMCRRLQHEIPDIVRGGTVPGPGFLAVMDGEHRPDAIFFLTDGEVGPVSLMLDRVSAKNQGRGLESVIHAVLLTHEPAAAIDQVAPDTPLDQLVRPTGGSITIVPLTGSVP